MFSFPSFEGVRLLRQMQVDYVIVHDDLAFAPAPELILKYLPLVYHDSQYNVSIYALNQLNKE